MKTWIWEIEYGIWNMRYGISMCSLLAHCAHSHQKELFAIFPPLKFRGVTQLVTLSEGSFPTPVYKTTSKDYKYCRCQWVSSNDIQVRYIKILKWPTQAKTQLLAYLLHHSYTSYIQFSALKNVATRNSCIKYQFIKSPYQVVPNILLLTEVKTRQITANLANMLKNIGRGWDGGWMVAMILNYKYL